MGRANPPFEQVHAEVLKARDYMGAAELPAHRPPAAAPGPVGGAALPAPISFLRGEVDGASVGPVRTY